MGQGTWAEDGRGSARAERSVARTVDVGAQGILMRARIALRGCMQGEEVYGDLNSVEALRALVTCVAMSSWTMTRSWKGRS